MPSPRRVTTSRSAFHGVVSSTCSTPELASRKAILFPVRSAVMPARYPSAPRGTLRPLRRRATLGPVAALMMYELSRRRKARIDAAREAEGRRAEDAELA